MPKLPRWLFHFTLPGSSGIALAETAAAVVEHPDMGAMHTGASLAVLAGAPLALVGGNAWAFGVARPGSPLRWAVLAGVLVLGLAMLLVLSGAGGE